MIRIVRCILLLSIFAPKLGIFTHGTQSENSDHKKYSDEQCF